mgnify:CR=1 FL=1
MDPGAYFETVIMSLLTAMIFIALILIFMYLVREREERAPSR